MRAPGEAAVAGWYPVVRLPPSGLCVSIMRKHISYWLSVTNLWGLIRDLKKSSVYFSDNTTSLFLFSVLLCA